MVKGYKWVRTQVEERLHTQVAKTKGRRSWDDVMAEALRAWVEDAAKAGGR